MISQTGQQSTQPMNQYAKCPNQPFPIYGQSHQTEVYQPMDYVPCALTWPNPEYGQSKTENKSTNPWISVPCALTWPNPGYGQSDRREVHQSMAKLQTNP
jgi:hypothetical protein